MSSAKARRTPSRRSPATETPFNESSVIGFKVAQAGVEQVRLRDDDYVESRGDLIATEDLSNQSFRSVSLNRSPEFPGGRDSQPSHPAVRQNEHGAVAAMAPDALFVHMLELGATANALVRAEGQRLSASGSRFGLIAASESGALLAADREALSALRSAAFQDQTAILGAHTHEKSMRFLAVARVGLKSPDSLSHDIPSE
jgi:hypothetical protein